MEKEDLLVKNIISTSRLIDVENQLARLFNAQQELMKFNIQEAARILHGVRMDDIRMVFMAIRDEKSEIRCPQFKEEDTEKWGCKQKFLTQEELDNHDYAVHTR